ncbi:MAG: HlyD family efflux transporter periplasmic adaptor subunit [Pirellulaceae bacterium]|nr:HlyD family efflux transporter periplasmic adaptor subunit [Pirellulaceae bacterium]
MSKTLLKLLLVAAVGLAAAFVAFAYWRSLPLPLPDGIASGNGRIEARLVDVAAKESLRVKEILVDEGDLVEPGQVVARLDTNTLEAELAEANANVASTMEREAVTNASIVRRKSEMDLASIELERARKLLERAAVSREEYDQRTTHLEVTKAELAEEQAKLRTVEQEVKAAQASVATIQTRIDDATLKSPVRGRVLYRLTEVGEVLAPGGKALTLVNLEDVYMEIFLPSEQAAKVRIGGDARVTVDHAPGRAAAGYVSFVSPEAQFTPKQVETRSERDKLMFRVKIQVPEELVHSYIERIKTGVRGVGYVKLDESAVWPDWLQDLLAPLAKPEGVEPSPPEESAARDSPSPVAEQDLSEADATTRPEDE